MQQAQRPSSLSRSHRSIAAGPEKRVHGVDRLAAALRRIPSTTTGEMRKGPAKNASRNRASTQSSGTCFARLASAAAYAGEGVAERVGVGHDRVRVVTDIGTLLVQIAELLGSTACICDAMDEMWWISRRSVGEYRVGDGWLSRPRLGNGYTPVFLQVSSSRSICGVILRSGMPSTGPPS